jgi:3-deoxy-manno-octulosonate cytidylyltransferase (CMP-KDO synthetase)
MSYTIVIPSRYGSSRLPGKPLMDIAGKPMVQHVWERAQQSNATRVVIATDDERIFSVASGFGAEVCMTATTHPSGTDRLQQVADQLELDDEHIVVNVQGDEPQIPTTVIDQVAANLAVASDASMATLCEPIHAVSELIDPNAVKVVTDTAGMALYFSRAPIPFPRDFSLSADAKLPTLHTWYRHIGIYAYRVKFLHQYVSWKPAPLEQLEQLEQLRAMYYGARIHVEQAAQAVPGGVDTQQDLEAVRETIRREARS